MADENEVMLELSIGGIFGKPNPIVTEMIQKDNLIEDLNTQSKRKREEKLKNSVNFGSCGSVSGPFVENKEWLEAQIDEPTCKKEKIVKMPEKFGSGLSATVDGGSDGDDDKDFVLRPMVCRSFKRYQGNPNEGGGRCYFKMKSNGCASLAYSDGQYSSHQGGASDDSRSNSCNSQLDHQPASTSTSVEPSDQHQPNGSSKQTITTTNLTNPTAKPFEPSNPHEQTLVNLPTKPEPSSQNQQASLLARMPCVSTTGNGPNGKTVSGFLYRYTKKEVSIVCVCHGRSFSPAGFVEHAGWVDVTHPLKHITIYPAAFAA